MLVTKTVKVKWNNANKKWYKSKGYLLTKNGEEFEVKTEDLTLNNTNTIKMICDNCNEPFDKRWAEYNASPHGEGKHVCKKCTYFDRAEKIRLLKLERGQSFEKWCVENFHQDILDRWDYQLNSISPNSIGHACITEFYFKCPEGIHKSELKCIHNITKGFKGSMDCIACGSIAEWGIKKYGKDFLNEYWSDKNMISPWEITYASTKKIWIICQEKDYHEDYITTCGNFTTLNNRCPYCNSNSGKVHPLDSVGTLYPEILKIWSDKNKKTPFEYSIGSKKKVWFKCKHKKHKDYYRNIKESRAGGFKCPACSLSKGEYFIMEYLMNLEIISTPQKKFKGLLGLGGGSLSYDFYIPSKNLLIEYDGEFHYIPLMGDDQFKKQKKHDELKTNYAKENKMDLLRIPYWEFDNLGTILDKQLNNISIQEAI